MQIPMEIEKADISEQLIEGIDEFYLKNRVNIV